MNLWYSELPLGHQYLICSHILQAAEWLSSYSCADLQKTSYSLANQLQKDKHWENKHLQILGSIIISSQAT